MFGFLKRDKAGAVLRVSPIFGGKTEGLKCGRTRAKSTAHQKKCRINNAFPLTFRTIGQIKFLLDYFCYVQMLIQYSPIFGDIKNDNLTDSSVSAALDSATILSIWLWIELMILSAVCELIDFRHE